MKVKQARHCTQQHQPLVGFRPAAIWSACVTLPLKFSTRCRYHPSMTLPSFHQCPLCFLGPRIVLASSTVNYVLGPLGTVLTPASHHESLREVRSVVLLLLPFLPCLRHVCLPLGSCLTASSVPLWAVPLVVVPLAYPAPALRPPAALLPLMLPPAP